MDQYLVETQKMQDRYLPAPPIYHQPKAIVMSPEFHKHWVDIFNTVPSYQDPILELASRLGIERQEAKMQHIAYLMNKDTTVCIMARNAYNTTEQLAELVMSYDPKFSSVGEVLDSLEE